MSYKAMDVAQYVVNYSLDKGYEISNLKLQKLLYYIQAAFLVEKREPCFDESIENWRHGPVVNDVYKKFKKYASSNIDYLSEYSTVKITADFKLEVIRNKYSDNPIKPDDKKNVNRVIKAYKNMNAWEMVERTHKEDPWKLDSDQDEEITNDSLIRYFNKAENKGRIYCEDI